MSYAAILLTCLGVGLITFGVAVAVAWCAQKKRYGWMCTLLALALLLGAFIAATISGWI